LSSTSQEFGTRIDGVRSSGDFALGIAQFIGRPTLHGAIENEGYFYGAFLSLLQSFHMWRRRQRRDIRVTSGSKALQTSFSNMSAPA
jgi:hypothetical protein